MDTAFTRALPISVPIVLAPMAGGPSTPKLVAAVSNAGGLGSHGGNYLSPEALRIDIQQIKALTNKPFAVNLFIPTPNSQPSDKEVQAMLNFTNEIRRKLGMLPLKELPHNKNHFSEQIEVVLEEAPRVFSFVFGVLESSLVREFKRRNVYLIGTASSLTEAQQLEESGVDAICLQGFEGGGHRGVFPANHDEETPLRPLLTSVRGKVKTPLIAAGGLMSGQDIREILALGASAAQLGTAFLVCEEAGTSKCYREALLVKGTHPTEITEAFSGRRARGLLNQYMKEFKAKGKHPLPFPLQNSLTQDLRKKSVELNVPDYCSLWAGTGVNRLREMSAENLIRTLVNEMTLEA